jgi:uncharacterized membrane protein YkoI
MTRTRWIAVASVAAVLIGGGTAIAVATGAGDDDRPIPDPALDRAVAAALEHTGGGTVIETEIGDEGAAYGVEIRLEDGTVIEIGLDERFNVIGEEAEDDGPGDRDGANDD